MSYEVELCQAEVCLATTISRTSRLQKLLTSHISATAIPGTDRTIHDLNRERSSLLRVRTHVECLLNKLLEIKRLGASTLISKDHCIEHLDEYRIQLLCAGQQAMRHIPETAAAHSAVVQVIGFVDGSNPAPCSPAPVRSSPRAGTSCGSSLDQCPRLSDPCKANHMLPGFPVYNRKQVLGGRGDDEACAVWSQEEACIDNAPTNCHAQTVIAPNHTVQKWMFRMLVLGGLIYGGHAFQRACGRKRSRVQPSQILPVQGEYIYQVFEATRAPNVRVVRPGDVGL